MLPNYSGELRLDPTYSARSARGRHAVPSIHGIAVGSDHPNPHNAAEPAKRPKIRIIAKPAVTPDAPADSM